MISFYLPLCYTFNSRLNSFKEVFSWLFEFVFPLLLFAYLKYHIFDILLFGSSMFMNFDIVSRGVMPSTKYTYGISYYLYPIISVIILIAIIVLIVKNKMKN